ncbi:MAG: hypothetical protein ACXQTN_03375 [Methanoculleaceae archaeon]
MDIGVIGVGAMEKNHTRILATSVLSLPVHPGVPDADPGFVSGAVNGLVKQ